MGILKGKVAVVTGSTSGIGLAYARAFAGAGANIVLNGIGAPTEVEKERSAIESELGVKAVYSPADMAKPDEIAELIALGEKTFGSVDVLVNNAGVQHVASIEEFPVDKWNAIFRCALAVGFFTAASFPRRRCLSGGSAHAVRQSEAARRPVFRRTVP